MKVLLINTFETKGGAAVACKRLARALQKQGADVSILVCEKKTTDSFVYGVIKSNLDKLHLRFTFLEERFHIFFVNRFHRKNLFAVSTALKGFDIVNHPLVKEADVIHLNWINQGFLSIHGIDQLLKLGKPVVWTMHDMWPITGICHHSRECNHYMDDCGFCMLLQKPSKKDLSYHILKRKKKCFQGAGIHFVACSQWLRKRAEISSLSIGNTITNIPNPIDTELFSPGDKDDARIALNLPKDKKLLLFGALIASDKRKGIDYLVEATHLLADLSENVELVFCGEIKEKIASVFGLKAHALGYISDPDLIVKMYQSADCFVMPSLEENLPNMIMEAMACGIPCVGFNVGGISEMIRHKQTGYVSVNKSAEDFAAGIRYVLERSDDADFKKSNRDFILSHYSESAVANRYMKLYLEANNKK
ncbi:MAG: glycosyltransferase family 4 protein [Bacteroidales bacterium]|nr:glycosyltransferase family 4 protein [Bacteroidales bacterium]